jgi:hypothetical protein
MKSKYILAITTTVFGIVLIGGISHFFTRKNLPEETVSQKTGIIVPPEIPAPRATPEPDNNATTSLPVFSDADIEEYNGPIRHIFFHSLIVYPEKALADKWNVNGYKDNMITVGQFKQILSQLYENGFLLIDDKLLYSSRENGNIRRNKLYLPKGKKPLILSLDDLSYYSYMEKGGFARKLVLRDGIVKTEVLTPEGNTIITDDGDVVPIIDAFVKKHPDFSLNGTKGIIGLTGFEGILGYRTQLRGNRGDIERQDAAPVVNALRETGWTFACHSYGHGYNYFKNTVSSDFLKRDISLWMSQVEPLVGSTNVFIGPFGQVFTDGDPRRKQLVDSGFDVLYGVGMDGYLNYFNNYLAMNRTNIDGYRLRSNTKKLYDLFGISVNESF